MSSDTATDLDPAPTIVCGTVRVGETLTATVDTSLTYDMDENSEPSTPTDGPGG